MADKETALSIVIRTVDRATAGIQAINKRLDAATKPARDFSKALGDLKEKSGFNAVAEGFSGVGSAIKDASAKLLAIGGIASTAVIAVKSLVDEFDDVGDKSEKLGVSADFLTAIRYAAERSGSSFEELDGGLQSFSENLGAARAGVGRMTKFLQGVAPSLLTQLKAAKSTEDAFLLLGDAMNKVSDPAKRLKLAAATVGQGALAPLLARGSEGMRELIKEFERLAGSQAEAVDGAGKVDDALRDLKASTQGWKAALVAGLSPALREIVDQLTVWFVEHRDDVKRWAEDVGKKIPAAVDKVVAAIKSVVNKIEWLADTFGGANIAIAGLAAVIVGPLIASLAALGVALMANPLGAIVVGAAAATAGIAALYKALNDSSAPVKGTIQEARTTPEYAAWQKASPPSIVTNPTIVKAIWGTGKMDRRAAEWYGYKIPTPPPPPPLRPLPPKWMRDPSESLSDPWMHDPSEWLRDPSLAAGTSPDRRADIKVTFENAPKGLRATVGPQNTANVDLTVGHQFGFGGM